MDTDDFIEQPDSPTLAAGDSPQPLPQQTLRGTTLPSIDQYGAVDGGSTPFVPYRPPPGAKTKAVARGAHKPKPKFKQRRRRRL